jgi:hypothetical protein
LALLAKFPERLTFAGNLASRAKKQILYKLMIYFGGQIPKIIYTKNE